MTEIYRAGKARQLTATASSAEPGSWPAGRWRLVGLAALTALSAYSAGIGWQAQFVSYPLFGQVSAEEFPAYHLDYNAAIPLVVIAPGFLTFLGCASFPFTRPKEVSRAAAAVVASSGVLALVSTLAWAIPMHDKLDRIGQDAATIDSLLCANSVRTAALTVGAVTLAGCLSRLAHSRAVDQLSY